MKKRSLLACGIAVLSLTACGRSYQGSYRGTELVSQNYGAMTAQAGQTAQPAQGTTQSAQSYSNALTISLNDGSGGSVNGTYQGGTQTGTLQGTASGTGLDNVVLTISAPSYQAQTGYGQNYGQSYGYSYGYSTGYNTGCGGVFVGNLALNNNRLTGTLNAQTATTCGITSISIDASK